MSQYIIIDGTEYKVAIAKLSRTADILDKSAHRSLDGELHREVIGTFINYTLDIYVRNDIQLYNRLFDVLSAPVPSHSVELPNDHIRYDGYFSSIKDEVDRIDSNGCRYKGLTCKLTAMRPRRRA